MYATVAAVAGLVTGLLAGLWVKPARQYSTLLRHHSRLHDLRERPGSDPRSATQQTRTAPEVSTMSIQDSDPLHRIAQQVADCLAGSGYAFIEDDQLDGLTAMLRSFLAHAADPAQLDVAATALDEARPGRAPG